LEFVANPPPQGRASLTKASHSASQGKALKDKDATWTQRITGLGYKQVYGSAAVWGDGITPVPVGQLEVRQLCDVMEHSHSTSTTWLRLSLHCVPGCCAPWRAP
jgi:hypothetical protein